MPYCEVADVRDMAECLGDVAEDKIVRSIRWADGYIDSALSKRFNTPFIPTPEIVRLLSIDLAAYETLRKIHSAGGEDEPVLMAKELKDRADARLKELQGGDSTAPVPGPGDPPVSTLPPTSVMGSSPAPGILRDFDGFSIPKSSEPPFSRLRGRLL